MIHRLEFGPQTSTTHLSGHHSSLVFLFSFLFYDGPFDKDYTERHTGHTHTYTHTDKYMCVLPNTVNLCLRVDVCVHSSSTPKWQSSTRFLCVIQLFIPLSSLLFSPPLLISVIIVSQNCFQFFYGSFVQIRSIVAMSGYIVRRTRKKQKLHSKVIIFGYK